MLIYIEGIIRPEFAINHWHFIDCYSFELSEGRYDKRIPRYLVEQKYGLIDKVHRTQ